MQIDHVLIIEDDEVSSVLLQFLIEDVLVPQLITIKSDGEEALTYLEERKKTSNIFPQLIFLDLNMPNLSGYEFVDLYEAKFSRLFPDTRLVVLTSSMREKDRKIAEQHPSISRFFHKPLDEKQLTTIKNDLW